MRTSDSCFGIFFFGSLGLAYIGELGTPAKMCLLQEARHVPEQPAPAASGSAPVARAGGGGGQKLHSSPLEILETLNPPGCRLTMNFRDHRFVATWKQSSELWDPWPEFNKKTYSRSFDSKNWGEKLSEVHSHMWRKWAVAQSELPLNDMDEQTPGVISDEIVSQLSPIIRQMPEKTKV